MSVRRSRWTIAETEPARTQLLATELGLSPLTARLLVQRKLHDADTARRFLQPKMLDLHRPDTLPDIDRAVTAIRHAVAEKQRITVYGDYDVDGLTATAIVLEFLGLLHADVNHYIPHRTREGYGLSDEAVRTIAADGTQLLVTVDCGVSARKEVALARQLGMAVVITDHHEVPETLPEAEAVVDPHRRDSRYPFSGLAGVGVAFKLCWAVADSFSPGKKVSPEFRQFLTNCMALVALGTVADIVPMVDENRTMVRAGLPMIARNAKPGLAALRTVARMADSPQTTTFDVAFKLAPRINAAGRIEHGELALELLTTEDPRRAAEIAAQLDKANTDRRAIQKTISDEAVRRVQEHPEHRDKIALVLADPDWHLGVVGIVAGKLADTFNRPSIVCSVEDGICRGSARSAGTVNILEAISRCSDLLDTFGGHARAAGVGFAVENLEAFRNAFDDAVRQCATEEDLQPQLLIDTDITLDELEGPFMDELAQLAPFGQDNPEPVLALGGVKLAGTPRLMGADGRHISFQVSDGNLSVRCVGFGMGELYDEILDSRERLQLAFSPAINTYRGARSIELHLLDVRAHNG